MRAGRWFQLHALLLKPQRAGRWLQLHVILPAKPPTKTRTLNKSQKARKGVDNAVWLTLKSIERIEHAGLKPTPKPTDEPKKLKVWQRRTDNPTYIHRGDHGLQNRLTEAELLQQNNPHEAERLLNGLCKLLDKRQGRAVLQAT